MLVESLDFADWSFPESAAAKFKKSKILFRGAGHYYSRLCQIYKCQISVKTFRNGCKHDATNFKHVSNNFKQISTQSHHMFNSEHLSNTVNKGSNKPNNNKFQHVPNISQTMFRTVSNKSQTLITFTYRVKHISKCV